jgi:H+/Cl- antiporter ClcA
MLPTLPSEDGPQYEPCARDGLRPTHHFNVLLVTSIGAILCGFAAVFFVYAERWGDSIIRTLSGEVDLPTYFGDGRISGIWTTLAPAGAIVAAMTFIIVVQRKWFPGTEGTGIPQAIAALKVGNSKARAKMLSLKIAIGKTLLLTVALLFGITVGREGPSVHVGACIMHLSNRFCRLPEHLLARGMILAGGAAGIAAAFNAPIAGVIFCFEEIGRVFDKASAATIIRTVAIACVVGVAFLGDYVFYTDVNANLSMPLSLPFTADGNQISFGEWLMSMRQWLAVPIVGVLGGFLGGWFSRAVVVTSRLTGPLLSKHPWRMGLAFGLVLAVIGIATGGESFGGGYNQTTHMLETAHSTGETVVAWHYPIGKAAASFISLISAIPGGLFDPSLAVGASLGQVTHGAFHDYLAPGIGLPQLMLLFMAAYFAGVVQSPITVFAILFEMTGAYGMILPLMFAAMLGAMVARLICNPSIYEALAIQFLAAKKLSAQE